jgi:cytoskeletal protein CcmA (bactofilin family)
MWNKRKDEDPPRPYTPTPVNPSPAASGPSETKKENLPVSSMPVPKHEPEFRSGPASIGKAVKIVGQIFSKEDLYVDGELDGTVEAMEHKVTVGPNGNLKAAVKAREVVVLGAVHGNVEATEKMEIRKDAKLVGDVRTARIVIEDGAYFKGSIDIVKPEPKVAPKAAPSAPPIVTAATAPLKL